MWGDAFLFELIVRKFSKYLCLRKLISILYFIVISMFWVIKNNLYIGKLKEYINSITFSLSMLKGCYYFKTIVLILFSDISYEILPVSISIES